ncbi:E3 ubiquitin-protein ligase TRIM33-like [Patiria miniata]|uniref:Tripartite motif-containing protein 2-like n=1 Tax=Patiria miniata TaxID=46514 RepID=A0A914A6I3_PATMI|nr:E3 ubiquitin-protein ligase TRIM33-like [Patiria miniata]
MAAGGTAEVLGKIGERHLECSICFNRFTEPKFLDCLHTFCLKCLKHIMNSKDPDVVIIKCPMCRRETTLESSGVEDLPTNFSLSALVEEFAVHEQFLEGQGSEIKCQSCDEQNQATTFCVNCSQFLCQDCHNAHERLGITKSHKTYTMAQFQTGEISYKSRLREEPKCGKHPDMNLNIYCNTCEQLLCTTCSVLKHQKHSFDDLTDAFDKCKQEIAELKAKAEDKKTALSNAKKNMANSRTQLDSMFEATNKKISQKADKEVAKIRETEQKLKHEAKEIYQDKIKTFETTEDNYDAELAIAEQTLDKMNQLLAQQIKTEILHLKRKFVRHLKEMTEKHPAVVPGNICFIDFQECDEDSLGRLLLKNEWKLARETKLDELYDVSRINSVAVFSNNEIVAVDSAHKQLITYSPPSDPHSPFTSQMPEIPDLRDPDQVAVNRWDQLIVLDGLIVKTFSREYQLLHQFQPGLDSDSKPTCLAVDDNSVIAVGYEAEGEISLHKPDGCLTKKISAPGIADQLVISNKHLIYTACLKGKMVSMDYNGDVIFKIDTDSPMSLCCDKQGDIYVGEDLHSLPSAANIHVYSPNGKHMDCLIKQCTYPLGMAFTPAGDLVLGGWGSLQIYQRE